MKKILFMALIGILSLNLSAQDSGFGLGVILGEPTGISAKTWISSKNAIDAAIAWSTVDDYLYVHADFLVHNFDMIKVSEGQLAFYFGLGAQVGFGSDLAIGARVPVGLDYLFAGTPLDIFLEIVPGLMFLPGIDFDIDAGIGIRYWF